MSKKNLHKIITLSVMTFMLAAFTHCVSEAPTKKSSSSGSSRGPASNANDSDNQLSGLAAVPTTTGIKNHEQIFHSMSAVTTVSTGNPVVYSTYRVLAGSLPASNDIKSLLPSHNVAIIRLASAFCDELIDIDLRDYAALGIESRVAIFETPTPERDAIIDFRTIDVFDFNRTEIRMGLIRRLVDNFWGGMLSEKDLLRAENDLENLLDELMVNEIGNAGARKVAKGVCTAALASAHVTFL